MVPALEEVSNAKSEKGSTVMRCGLETRPLRLDPLGQRLCACFHILNRLAHLFLIGSRSTGSRPSPRQERYE